MNSIDMHNPLTWVFIAIAACQLFRISKLQWMFNVATRHEIPPAIVALIAGGGVGAMVGECPGHPWLWLAAAVGIWALGCAVALIPGPMLSSGVHYWTERSSNPGRTRRLYLLQMEAYHTGVHLTYQCPSRLSAEEADHVDSRLRAFIACCMGDAAKRARLKVSSGPPHGRRPSWMLADLSVPMGLQHAGFEQDRNTWLFSLSVGPIILGGKEVSEQVATALGKSFLRHYRIVRV